MNMSGFLNQCINLLKLLRHIYDKYIHSLNNLKSPATSSVALKVIVSLSGLQRHLQPDDDWQREGVVQNIWQAIRYLISGREFLITRQM